MRNLSIFLVPLFLAQSLSLEAAELPRRHNFVSEYLDRVLESLFEKLSTGNLSIPDVNLGKEVGSVSKIVGNVLGGLEKKVDSDGILGVKLSAEGRKILLKGQYHFLSLTLPGLFPIVGKGDFLIYLELVSVNLNLKINYNISEEIFTFDMKKLDIQVQNSTVRFENLMNDSHLADFLNTLISSLIPDVLEMFQGHILTLSQAFLDFFGNDIMKCIKDNITSNEKIQQCIQDIFKGIYDDVDHSLGTNLTRKFLAWYSSVRYNAR